MDKKGFKQKWGEFLDVIFSPGSVLPLVIAGLILFASFRVDDETLSNSLVIFATILTAIAGFFIKDAWDQLQGSSLLEKKGRSALRNLEAINQQVLRIRGWMREFQKASRRNKTEILKEIDRHLGVLEFNIRSGVEDWVDIEPALRKNKETVNTYQDVLRSYMEELLKNRKELLQVKEDKDKERLKERIKDLEKNVKQLKEDRPQVFAGGFGGSGFSGPSAVSLGAGVGALSSLDEKVCQRCGRRYKEDLASVSLVSSNLCPNCQ